MRGQSKEIVDYFKVSELGLIPILFIPANSDKLLKFASTQILSALLEPSIQELEENLINGFHVFIRLS